MIFEGPPKTAQLSGHESDWVLPIKGLTTGSAEDGQDKLIGMSYVDKHANKTRVYEKQF